MSRDWCSLFWLSTCLASWDQSQWHLVTGSHGASQLPSKHSLSLWTSLYFTDLNPTSVFLYKVPTVPKEIDKKSPHECSVIFGHYSQRLWELTVMLQPVNLDPEKNQTSGYPPRQACACSWLSGNTIWRKQTLSLQFSSLLWTSVLPYSSCVSPFADWPWVSALPPGCTHTLWGAPHGVLVANIRMATPCSGN